MELETGDTADYRTTPEGIELEILDADEKRLAMRYFRWDEVAPLLRGLYARQLDGFEQEHTEPDAETVTPVEQPPAETLRSGSEQTGEPETPPQPAPGNFRIMDDTWAQVGRRRSSGATSRPLPP